MNINEYTKFLGNPSHEEKPLDNIVDDGGLTSYFRTIAVVGDSLASGEFQAKTESGGNSFHDMYEYSWGQFMARAAGCKVYNFSCGGMTARQYMSAFGLNKGFFDRKLAAQAYVIALGVNDLLNRKWELGALGDKWSGVPDAEESFAAYYCAIIERYKEIQPEAKFFLVSIPKSADDLIERNAICEAHNKLLHQIAEKYENTYVIDLFTYMSPQTEEFKDKFYLTGHLNPAGYYLFAKAIMSYIDYIIRHNIKDFREVPFIGTGIKNYDTAK